MKLEQVSARVPVLLPRRVPGSVLERVLLVLVYS